MRRILSCAVLLFLSAGGSVPAAAQSRQARAWPPASAPATAAQAGMLISLLRIPGLDPMGTTAQEALGAIAAQLPPGALERSSVSPEQARAALERAAPALANSAQALAQLAVQSAFEPTASPQSIARVWSELKGLAALGPSIAAALAPALRTFAALEEAKTLASARELAARLAARPAGEPAPILTARPDLLVKLVSAADLTLGVNVDEPLRSRPLNYQTVAGLERLRALGVSEPERNARARLRLEAALSLGRRHGLSSSSLDLPPGSPRSEGSELERRHELSRWKALLAALDERVDGEHRAGETGLQHAHGLALSIGDGVRARESLLQMLRLKLFNDAAGAAESAGDSGALFTTGMLALAEFLYGRNPYDSASSSRAIEILKRVRGAMEEAASAVLHDLGLFLSEPDFLDIAAANAEERRIHLDHAMRAMRSAGRAVHLRVNAWDMEFFTLVEEPARAAALRRLARLAIEANGGVLTWDALKALAATRDADAVRHYAAQALGGSAPFHIWDAAWRWALSSIGETTLLSAFGRMTLENRGWRSHPRDHIFTAARYFAEAGDRAGLEDARRALFQDAYPDTTDRDWDKLAEIAGRPAPKAPSLSPAQKQVQNARDMLARFPALDEARKAAKIVEGDGFLVAGDSWAASKAFLEARHAPGLIKAGDALLANGDGENAWNFFAAAALLENER